MQSTWFGNSVRGGDAIITTAVFVKVPQTQAQMPSGLPVSKKVASSLKAAVKAGDLIHVCYGQPSSLADFRAFIVTDAPTNVPEPEKGAPSYLLPGNTVEEPDSFSVVEMAELIQLLGGKAGWIFAEVEVSVEVEVLQKSSSLTVAEKGIYKIRGWSEDTFQYAYMPESQKFERISDVVSTMPWESLQAGLKARFQRDPDALDQLDELAYSASMDALDKISGQHFERLCSRLISSLGFNVTQTLASHDGGVDLLAAEISPFRGNSNYVFSCKRLSSTVGVAPIRELDSVVGHHQASHGILMTNNRFSREAQSYAVGKPLSLVDGPLLRTLMEQHNLLPASEGQ